MVNIKRYAWVVGSLLLAFFFLEACNTIGALKQTATRVNGTLPPSIIRIGTDARFPPFETFDMNMQIATGFDIDLINAIAAKTGLEVVIYNVDLNQLLTGLSRCQYDLGISGISATDELKQYMNFSDPYYSTGQVVVVKKGNITINGRDQLPGMTVGVKSGSPGALEIARIPQAQSQVYNSYDLAFNDLITGDIEAIIAELPRALSYVKINANNLKIVGEEFGSVQYGIAICKNRSDLLKKVNDGLAAIEADGTLEELVKKWGINNLQ